MESLFTTESYAKTLDRIDALTPSQKPQWGKMTVSQMLAHCQKPLEIALYNKDFGLKSNFLIRTFFKKAMYDDSSFRKNMPTPKRFKVSEPKDFTTEKAALKELIEAFHQLTPDAHLEPHPVFGKLTTEQWGKMQYKHLNHHLNQFGV